MAQVLWDSLRLVMRLVGKWAVGLLLLAVPGLVRRNAARIDG